MIKKTIIITGTHHTPAIELIRQLKQDKSYKWKIFYITHAYKTETHIKNSLKPLLKDNLFEIDCGKYDRQSLWKTFLQTTKTIKAVNDSIKIIKCTKANIVVSFGGYVSVPVVFAAWASKVPSITHEQTTTLSLSTRINSLFANKIALSFPVKQLNPKQVVTGNLIRQQIFSKKTVTYKKLKKIINKKPLILVSGGNQGSTTINKAFLSIANKLSPKFTIIHHTGNLDYSWIKKATKKLTNYYITKYIGQQDIGWVLNKAHMVINRAGANYSQEIVTLRKNAILIPFPFSQQDEQLKNAKWVKSQLPQTIIIDQARLTPTKLLSAINKLNKIKNNQTFTKPTQNKQFLKLIHQYV